ncbi:MAG: phytanoyl-CoA dioxygenase family protein [Spirochaetaceae bacterium]|nr:phytanoyl-CoA dioxygenase family protein [Spirochaetaceae bacterium]
MDERQKYLFDTRGYLVLDDVLSEDQCTRLIAAVNERIEVPDGELPEGVTSSNEPTLARLGDLTSAGPEFCELIDIPRVIDLLRVIVHHQLRLENTYAYVRRKGFPGLRMHGGGSFDSNGQDLTLMYRHFNGRIFSGHTVVAFNLTDVSEEEGGFACIPGSHKANFSIPEDMKTFENGVDRSLIQCVPCRAGSAVIFTEALCHGATPWTSDRERVTLFYKYHHAGMKFHSFFPSRAALERMTPSQRSFYIEVSADSRDPRLLYPALARDGHLGSVR